MKKLILIGCIFVIGCSAQRSDTIFQTLGTNVATNGSTANVTNIGQSGHTVLVRGSNATGQTCGQISLSAKLEYSFDGTNYYSFGYPITVGTGTGITSAIYYGTGPYPFVRFTYTFNTTECRLSITYTGSIVPSVVGINGITPFGQPSQTINPVVMGAWSGSGQDADTINVTSPFITCNTTAFTTVNAGTTGLVVSIPNGTPKFRICSILLSASAASTAKIISANADNCTTNATDRTPTITFTAPVTLGSGLGPVVSWDMQVNVGNRVCLTATGGNVGVLINYAATTY